MLDGRCMQEALMRAEGQILQLRCTGACQPGAEASEKAHEWLRVNSRSMELYYAQTGLIIAVSVISEKDQVSHESVAALLRVSAGDLADQQIPHPFVLQQGNPFPDFWSLPEQVIFGCGLLVRPY
jgi:predicted Zn-dependent protease